MVVLNAEIETYLFHQENKKGHPKVSRIECPQEASRSEDPDARALDICSNYPISRSAPLGKSVGLSKDGHTCLLHGLEFGHLCRFECKVCIANSTLGPCKVLCVCMQVVQ